MIDNRSMTDILEDGYQVNMTMKGPVEVDSKGELDNQTVRQSTDKLFKFVTDYLRKDFLEIKKEFPKQGVAEVDLSIDMVVLKGDDYRKLKRIADRYEYLFENYNHRDRVGDE